MPESLILGAAEVGESAFPVAFVAVYAIFWVVFLTVVVAAYAIGIWAIIDAARRPDYQFVATGQSKIMWILLPAVGLVTCQPVALVAGLIFLLSVRKKLNAVPVPPPGWYGYGPTLQPGWNGPGSPPPPGWYGAYPPQAPVFQPGSAPVPWAGAPAGGWTAGPPPPSGPVPMPAGVPPDGVRPVGQEDFAPPPDQPPSGDRSEPG